MAYTEIKKRNDMIYFYRVVSARKGKKVSKNRKYLGVNLTNDVLFKKEAEADKELLAYKREKVNAQIDKIKSEIVPILKKNNVKKAGIFGSYARGEQKKNSDIDILIEPPAGMGLGFIGLALDLEEKLGKKVDLVTYKSIHRLLKKQILKDQIRVI